MSDASSIFYAQYVTEMKQIRDSITIAMQKLDGHMSVSAVSDAEQLRQLIRHDDVYKFLQLLL